MHANDKTAAAASRVDRIVPAGSEKMVRAKNQLVSDFNALVSDAEELLRSTASYSGDAVSAARRRFQDSVDHVKTRVYDAQDAAVSTWNEASGAAQGYVRDNPWKVAGTAALMGVIVGFLLHRR